MGCYTLLLFFTASLSCIVAQNVEEAKIVVNSTALLTETDENYICATIDWWPHDKCNYNRCPWGYSSAINLDLDHPLLSKLIQAFKRLRIRIGGSLQDEVKYDVGNLNSPCHPFAKESDGLFGFSKGCLHMSRWDDLNNFFVKTGLHPLLWALFDLCFLVLCTSNFKTRFTLHPIDQGLGSFNVSDQDRRNLVSGGASEGRFEVRGEKCEEIKIETESEKRPNAIMTFGLNALYGRHKITQGVWGGDWNSTNTQDFIRFTISRGYQIDSWEFGNELSGKGIGASVGAEQYGKDIINLKAILDKLYKNFHPKPLLVAPGGFYEKEWYDTLLKVSGSHVVNVMTHHIYNLGPGVDPNLVNKILNPLHLSRVTKIFSSLEQTIHTNGPWASAWVGESGGAYNSGGRHVSDTFVNSFWYLDQLGIAAKYNTKVYCRQTLIGGHYGLINATTLIPNPDYYSALLWHQLMGKGVLSVESNASPHLRSYAHCSKGRVGVTLLLINLSNQTYFLTSVQTTMSSMLSAGEETSKRKKSLVHHLKKTVTWIGGKASDEDMYREEYHLTPKNGEIQSKIMLLNGVPLVLTDDGDIPSLAPVHVNIYSPLSVDPLSIKFIVLPNFNAPGCE